MLLHPNEFREHLAAIITDDAFLKRSVEEYKLRWLAARVVPEKAAEPAPAPVKKKPHSYHDQMEESSATLLRAIEKARVGANPRAPANLVWTHPSGREMPNNTGASSHLYQYAEPARTDRDPCPRCGARGDYPCGHRKAYHRRLAV